MMTEGRFKIKDNSTECGPNGGGVVGGGGRGGGREGGREGGTENNFGVLEIDCGRAS